MHNHDEQEEDLIPSAPAFIIANYEQSNQITRIYLSRDIGPPHEYVEIIERLRTASPGDEIHLHFNNEGGYVSTGVQIIHAINESQATVVGVLDGVVCSMSAMAFLACHEHKVHDHGLLMLHNYSGGTIGKGHEQRAKLDAINDWFARILKDSCTPFINEAELQLVLSGKDMWFSAPEIEKRLQVVHEQRDAVIIEQQLEMLNQQEQEIADLRNQLSPQPAPKKSTRKK